MTAPLSLETLTGLVDTGEIDTVMMAQIDMQGRLMGKRFHARHFLDSGVEETVLSIHPALASEPKSGNIHISNVISHLTAIMRISQLSTVHEQQT